MLSMNLHLGGLANLITGIGTARIGGEFIGGKFDFWYQ
jgi:succinate-acetate transporter protein